MRQVKRRATSYPVLTVCLGRAEDIAHDDPQCQETGTSQIVTKIDRERGRPEHHIYTDTLKSLTSDGLSTRQIAEKLGVSHMTVARRLASTG